jgi:hypothetical protein
VSLQNNRKPLEVLFKKDHKLFFRNLLGCYGSTTK